MPQTTIRLKSPVDLITTLPYLLGFHPKRSVVVVCMEGAHVGLVQRIDIPPLEHTQDAMAAMVAPMLKQRPSAVVLIGYEDVEGESVPLLEALKGTVMGTHIDLADLLVVRDGRWYSNQCTVPACCPPEGRSLPENVAVASEFVAMGHNPLDSRESVAARLEARPGAITLPDAEWVSVPDAKAAWAKLLTGDLLLTQEVQDAALILKDVDFRDALIAHMWPGVLAPELISDETKAIFEDMPEVVTEGAVDRLIAFCSALSDKSAAPALTILANYAWFIGDGGMARMALDRALRCDPKYRLAQLLDQMVVLAVRPPVA